MWQLEQIQVGLEHGLTETEILSYAKKEYDNLQMSQIRRGIENNLFKEQISVYDNIMFTSYQM